MWKKKAFEEVPSVRPWYVLVGFMVCCGYVERRGGLGK